MKTSEQQLNSIAKVNTIMEEKLEKFKDLIVEDKLIKINDISDKLQKEFTLMEQLVIELNAARENCETDNQVKECWEKIYPHIDYLFTYLYSFMSYKNITPEYTNISDSRYLITWTLQYIKDAGYDEYHRCFNINHDQDIFEDVIR